MNTHWVETRSDTRRRSWRRGGRISSLVDAASGDSSTILEWLKFGDISEYSNRGFPLTPKNSRALLLFVNGMGWSAFRGVQTQRQYDCSWNSVIYVKIYQRNVSAELPVDGFSSEQILQFSLKNASHATTFGNCRSKCFTDHATLREFRENLLHGHRQLFWFLTGE